MSRPKLYVLDQHHLALPVFDDVVTWARAFEQADNRVVVAKTDTAHYLVLTVFLGIDHQWGSGEPLLFETMVFLPPEQHAGLVEIGTMERYSTWAEAQAGHERIAAMLAFEAAAAHTLSRDALRRLAQQANQALHD